MRPTPPGAQRQPHPLCPPPPAPGWLGTEQVGVGAGTQAWQGPWTRVCASAGDAVGVSGEVHSVGGMQSPLAIREGPRRPRGGLAFDPMWGPPLLPLLGVGEELGCWAPGPRRAEQVALGQGRGRALGEPPVWAKAWGREGRSTPGAGSQPGSSESPHPLNFYSSYLFREGSASFAYSNTDHYYFN